VQHGVVGGVRTRFHFGFQEKSEKEREPNDRQPKKQLRNWSIILPSFEVLRKKGGGGGQGGENGEKKRIENSCF